MRLTDKRMNDPIPHTVGNALWHFAVFVPDRFWGGIIGAFLARVRGRDPGMGSA
jgi:hypothetical protein